MLERLAHRGPDGGGVHMHARTNMGFRRLAIVDRAGGAQPLSLRDNSVVVTANGEIYNHRALRAELAGHPFTTRVDIEVILHGYAQWGLEVFGRLRGMFAVAIADHRRSRLVLARDRVGKKPLYYTVRDGVVRWSSELGALLGDERPPIDRTALNDYLRFGYVPAPRTLLQDVSKLEAGCMLLVEDGWLETRRWSPVVAVGPEAGGQLDGLWQAEIRETLADAVAARLESEVPLGFLLSGGVDSASVFALGAQALGRGNARAFTLGFSDRSVDETQLATDVARRYGARHLVHRLERAGERRLEDVVAQCGEPIATDALLPTDRVFAAVRAADITTILAGEGADEIFAGYRKFRPALDAVAGMPAAWEGAGATPLERYLASEEFSFPSLADRRALIGDAATNDGYGWLEDEIAGLDPLAQMLCAEVALRLPDRINARLDRLSMAYGVEARAPFMDPAMIGLALRVPHHLRSRGGRVKAVLREALRHDLPDSVLHAPKAPFRAPLAWFGTERDLSPAAVAEAGLVDVGAVGRLHANAAAGDRTAAEQLYNLQILHMWHRTWYQGRHHGVA